MNNILSALENYMLDNADDIAKSLANDFRKRRIEKISLATRWQNFPVSP